MQARIVRITREIGYLYGNKWSSSLNLISLVIHLGEKNIILYAFNSTELVFRRFQHNMLELSAEINVELGLLDSDS